MQGTENIRLKFNRLNYSTIYIFSLRSLVLTKTYYDLLAVTKYKKVHNCYETDS